MIVALAFITPIPLAEALSEQYEHISGLRFNCQAAATACPPEMSETFAFYKNVIFPVAPAVSEKAIEFELRVTLETAEYPRDYTRTNESYFLRVAAGSGVVEVDAYDIFGLARALATLSQLVSAPDYTNAFVIRIGEVRDAPKFVYRAVMVDSARHFLPIAALRREVNALSVAKMSVLHIHEVDSQSFPMQTVTPPGSNFARAAYKVGRSYVHTLEDYAELTRYAANLGVFIELELDIPGHAASWQFADVDITCECSGRDVVNPVNDKTYEHIRTYFSDIFNAIYKPLGMTPMVHLGGDEVQHWCFDSDKRVSAYMKENSLTTRSLWQRMHNNVTRVIEEIAAKMYPERANEPNPTLRVYWQESFQNGNDHSNGGVMHSWMSSYTIREAAQQGIYAIRSEAWYLDVNQPGPSFYSFVDAWQGMYDVKVAENVPEDKMHFVLGGGACQWGEKVHDGNIDEQIWPRSLAVAEILWSNPEDRRITTTLKKRLNAFTCKIRQAGTRSGAITNGQPCHGVDDTGKPALENWRAGDAEGGWSGRE